MEKAKKPLRKGVINFLISYLDREITYLEIGLRDPNDNFNHVNAKIKYSVDPGLEFEANPADFKITSDEFFNGLRAGKLLNKDIKFDVIFIDGLHLAEQVDRDIENSLKYIIDDGFIVLHDCNPPTEWHARENYHYIGTPVGASWNGTTWKGFMKWRFNSKVFSCCIDTDYGVGIISRKTDIGHAIAPTNLFYEYHIFQENRIRYLNLIQFKDLEKKLKKQHKDNRN